MCNPPPTTIPTSAPVPRSTHRCRLTGAPLTQSPTTPVGTYMGHLRCKNQQFTVQPVSGRLSRVYNFHRFLNFRCFGPTQNQAQLPSHATRSARCATQPTRTARASTRVYRADTRVKQPPTHGGAGTPSSTSHPRHPRGSTPRHSAFVVIKRCLLQSTTPQHSQLITKLITKLITTQHHTRHHNTSHPQQTHHRIVSHISTLRYESSVREAVARRR